MFPFVYKISLLGWFHLFLFGLVLPGMVIVQAGKLRDRQWPLPSRRQHFQARTLELAMFGAISLVVARVGRIELFPRAMPPWPAVLAGLAMLAITLAFMRPRWRRAVERRARIVYFFMPENGSERVWWIVVAVLAGVGEEITWRGVQAALTGSLTGSAWIAAIVCALSFGAAHYNQGWKSAASIVLFALGFHLLVWLSGSLYVAMAVHVTYDIVAGLSYGRLGRELGYRLEPPENVAAETG